MTDRSPVILEVALNGVTMPQQNPAVPRRPEQIAEDALRCLEAGATIIHTHTDDFALPPEKAADLYLQAYREVLDERLDAILYPMVGFGESAAERHAHHEVLARAGAIRMGLLDPGSVNLGGVAPDGLPTALDLVYANGPSAVRLQIEACRRLGLGGAIAIFEPGWLRVVVACSRAGTLPVGSLVKFYFSESGYLGSGEPMFSPPPIPEALALYEAMLGDLPIPWAVAVLGGSLLDSPVVGPALQHGGHLRVGLEDHPTAESNLAEVARARRLCEDHGRRLATPAETEAILGLPPLRS